MSKQRPTLNFDRIISVTAVLISASALFFAWQANRISNRQFTPQSVIISADYWSGDWEQETTPENWRFANCEHKIRIYNLGGASDSIIRYEAFIEYEGQALKLESVESQVIWSPGLQPYFVSVNTELLSENLPLIVEPFRTKEIIAKLGFAYDENLLDINVSYPYNPSYDYEKRIELNDSPLTIQYKFYTAEGKVLDTGQLICHYFR
jgi:hypothetical protein